MFTRYLKHTISIDGFLFQLKSRTFGNKTMLGHDTDNCV